MKKIEIFDPAMCCSTGVCGPSIDPELMRITTVINTLKGKGIIIKRHGLSGEPQDFIANQVISDILQKEGADILPITLVDGQIFKTKGYPSNDELSNWLEIKINTNQPRNKGEGNNGSNNGFNEGADGESRRGCNCGPKGCC